MEQHVDMPILTKSAREFIVRTAESAVFCMTRICHYSMHGRSEMDTNNLPNKGINILLVLGLILLLLNVNQTVFELLTLTMPTHTS